MHPCLGKLHVQLGGWFKISQGRDEIANCCALEPHYIFGLCSSQDSFINQPPSFAITMLCYSKRHIKSTNQVDDSPVNFA